MVLQHVWGLFVNPKREWQAIREDKCTIGKCYAVHVLILAAIPAISGFIGTTQFGWQIGAGDPVKLTAQSAGIIAVLYYLAMIVGVFSIGWMIHWMAETYGAETSLSQCVVLAAYTATPLFLIGIMQLYPVPWVNLVVGIPALAYTVYLLYSGVPIMMGISEDRGFLFSSAVLAVGLVALVALLAATAILWGMGLGPQYTR
ncbi:MAG: Yip1 family protein [Thiohalobacterales bacterium]|nr:Yip1 family protein [Thiohalobacterales bacterium]